MVGTYSVKVYVKNSLNEVILFHWVDIPAKSAYSALSIFNATKRHYVERVSPIHYITVETDAG
jgi:hypothetical protein